VQDEALENMAIVSQTEISLKNVGKKNVGNFCYSLNFQLFFSYWFRTEELSVRGLIRNHGEKVGFRV
jgi:hypothetical protein